MFWDCGAVRAIELLLVSKAVYNEVSPVRKSCPAGWVVYLACYHPTLPKDKVFNTLIRFPDVGSKITAFTICFFPQRQSFAVLTDPFTIISYTWFKRGGLEKTKSEHIKRILDIVYEQNTVSSWCVSRDKACQPCCLQDLQALKIETKTKTEAEIAWDKECQCCVS